MNQSPRVTAVEQQMFDHVPATQDQADTMLLVVDELLRHHVADERHQKVASQAVSMTVLEKMASRLGISPVAAAQDQRQAQRLDDEAAQFIQTYPGIVDLLADRGT